MKFYAIRHRNTGLLLEFSADSNEGSDFCSSVRLDLRPCKHGGTIYVNTDRADVQRVIDNPGKWYSSTAHRCDPADLEIVELLPCVQPVS